MKIRAVRLFNIEMKEDEFETLRYLLGVAEENVDSSSTEIDTIFDTFKIPRTQAPEPPVEDFDDGDGPIVPPEPESLPEKALRVSGQRTTSTRRKGRLTGNE